MASRVALGIESEVWFANYSACVLYTKKLFTSMSVKAVDSYLAASQLGKYPPLYLGE